MTDFERKVPTYRWQLWFGVAAAYVGLALAVAGIVLLDEGVAVWPITVFLFVMCIGFPLEVLRRRRNPDVTECRVADGQIYWHTPAPKESTVQISLASVRTLVIDAAGSDGGLGVFLTLDDGQQLSVPEECTRRHWLQFTRAVRASAPHVCIKQYGAPLYRI